MTQPTVDVLAADLEPLGPWPPAAEAFSGTPHAFGLELSDDGRVQTGIWECTPGSFPSRRDGICELMTFFAGDATITDADGTRHEIRPGVVRFFPDGWSGTWEIRETVRKTYAIVRTAPQ
jgi:uncharacterized cupin superfamily protein